MVFDKRPIPGHVLHSEGFVGLGEGVVELPDRLRVEEHAVVEMRRGQVGHVLRAGHGAGVSGGRAGTRWVVSGGLAPVCNGSSVVQAAVCRYIVHRAMLQVLLLLGNERLIVLQVLRLYICTE